MKRRNTPTKEAILKVLGAEGKAMSQDEIANNISMEINRATIYRVLNRFCADGILHKVVAEDSKQYFALHKEQDQKKGTHQHLHFKCNICETLECLPNEVNFSIPKGYHLENVNCVLTGTCKNCSLAAKTK